MATTSTVKNFGDNGAVGTAVTTDASNDMILAGFFDGVIDFGGGGINNPGVTTGFIAKFDSNGAHIFSKQLAPGSDASARDVAVDPSGNIFVTGGFTTVADFGGGPILPSCGGGSISSFLVKLDKNGKHVYSLRFSGAGQCGALATQLGVDALGNAVIAGGFTGTVDFAGKALTSQGSDLFVVKLDPSGKVTYAVRFGPGVDAGMFGPVAVVPGNIGVAVAPGGEAIVVGAFTGVLRFWRQHADEHGRKGRIRHEARHDGDARLERILRDHG